MLRPLWLRTPRRPLIPSGRLRHNHTSVAASRAPETDEYSIPLQPIWSVHNLLSSYPQPTLSASTLKRLHDLSALISPEEGTLEHAKLTREMEELVKLVEAVKLVDTSAVGGEEIPDGRIWAEGTGIELAEETAAEQSGAEGRGRDLLRYSSCAKNDMYMVKNDRPK